jgi:hypothetical protein
MWWGHSVPDAERPSILEGVFVRAWSFGKAVKQELGLPGLMSLGMTRVLVRLSRATGLPDFLPDISGLALRVPSEGAAMEICCWLQPAPVQ